MEKTKGSKLIKFLLVVTEKIFFFQVTFLPRKLRIRSLNLSCTQSSGIGRLLNSGSDQSLHIRNNYDPGMAGVIDICNIDR